MQLPSNVKVFDGEQGTEEWKKARLGIPTASKAGDIMKRTRYGQPYATRKDYIMQLALERVTGEATEVYYSADMEEGNDRERTAALAYEFETGNETEQVGFLYNHLCGASPDNLIVGERGGVEYKNPKPATHLQTITSGEIPEYYKWQIIQNLLVTEYDYWDYVSYCPSFPPNAQLFIKRLHRSQVEEELKDLAFELEKVNQEIEAQVQFILNYKA